MAGFVHLHNHSEYSLLDGLSRLDDLARKAQEFGLPAVALTDHGVLYGAVDFYRACKARGVNPIIGCEVYTAARGRTHKQPGVDDAAHHLVLLAANATGYRNLVKLVSLGHLEGFYYKPRVDTELLAAHAEGLIALSGCLSGEIPRLLLAGRADQARKLAGTYRDIFGSDGFFLELQDHYLGEERHANAALLELAHALGLGVVATNDSHYLTRADAEAHDVLLCIQTLKTIADKDRLTFPNDEFYFKPPGEMEALFSEVPEALSNTLAIAERCSFEFQFGGHHLPQWDAPGGEAPEQHLRRRCAAGLVERYGPEPGPERSERLERELGLICRMGFAGYFLVVADFVDFARSRGIPVGPGRGSGPGCLVAYVLGITGVDPIQHGLLFDRFLNPERLDMPDLDIDFCWLRRGEVIDYVAQKYGTDRVAQIISFGTMAPRAAIRDVGRALNLTYADVDRIAKLVPFQLGGTLDKALESGRELRELYESNGDVRRVVDMARKLEGLARHASMHAAGVVIAHEPLIDHVPLQRTPEGHVITQFPHETLKDLGLMKMDFLGLRTLTVLADCLRLLKAQGRPVDVDAIPLDDRSVYELLSSGETCGVFQLESGGMTDLVKRLKPERFGDLVALLALFRPGPLGSGMVEEFVARRHGQKVTYPHPSLEPILADTYGVMVYQEQVIRAATDLAGFTPGRADLLRRAMSKKQPEVLARQRGDFIAGCRERGIPSDVAGAVFDLMAHFAGYAFNKSHTTPYALLAYQTAYLKAHYPVQYMAALLNSVKGTTDRVAVYTEECRRMGIKVLPPDIGTGEAEFTVAGKEIRFGLAAVKNVGEGAVRSILEARQKGPFVSLRDFCSRVDTRALNRRAMESLIRAGAMGSLGRRSQLLEILDQTLELVQGLARMRQDGQVSFFDLTGQDPGATPDDLPDIAEFPVGMLLAMEREMLGLYVSGHPLGEHQAELRRLATVTAAGLSDLADGALVLMGGLVTGGKRVTTRNGEPMLFLELEDLTGTVEVVIFPKVYERARAHLNKDCVILVKGSLDRQEEQVKLLAEDVAPLGRAALYVMLLDDGRMEELLGILGRHPGADVVYVKRGAAKWLELNARYHVRTSPELSAELEQAFGPEAVRLRGSG